MLLRWSHSSSLSCLLVQLAEMHSLLLHDLLIDVPHLSIAFSMHGCGPSRWKRIKKSLCSLLKLLKNHIITSCIDLTLISAWIRALVDIVQLCETLLALELGPSSIGQIALSRTEHIISQVQVKCILHLTTNQICSAVFYTFSWR